MSGNSRASLGAVLVFLGWVLGFAPMAAMAAAELLDKVAVIVEDDIIMESELQQRLSMVNANLKKQAGESAQMPDPDELRHQVLERMIVESLQLQMGERAGVRITDTALNEAIGRIAAQNGMNLDQFRQALEADGSSYVAMRESVRQEMILKRVQQGNVNNRVQITEHEVDNFLQSEEGRQLTAANYRVGHYMIVAGEDMTAEQRAAAAALAASLVTELKAGRSFEELMKQSSLNGFETQGGDLGWRKKDDLPSLFAEVVPALEVGAVSEPVQAGNGWHIVKLMDQRGGETRMVEQTSVRHILLKTSEILSDEQAQAKMKELRNSILDGSGDFAELAREHSEDIGSARDGGELGWTSAGQMVPAFEQVMAQTEIGEVSEPFRSEFGWHILQVDDRRNQDVSDQLVKNRASQFIYQRKFEEELQAWLQKIRDEAYIDIK